MQKFKAFLTTPAGSWTKVFIAAVLAQMLVAYVDHSDFFSWDKSMWKKVFSASVAGLFPMIINALNPKYPLYGNKPKDDIIIDNPKVDTPE